ncbi:stress response translation initiation inhibitor YciH [Ferrimonas balearica]|uniref:stress response translation initiation inhibitor YciH n=1 Tax=Ferrimonas balearica TaxID=44012 RepID=UPI001C99D146|nr:stress response translation initiation inhibitor YciH [Ferrimonas balearica]MBY5921817.1 stress response translation initiation inhibitor YciH [Ferrimonas balearica]MBY5994843.1 stress response translation initiation inhibitor YciH [Ferrimonas balearica]
MISNSDSQLVYSTDKGRIQAEPAAEVVPQGDGIVRIQMERKGRKGKGAMVITGLGLDSKALKALAGELKKKMGCGGAVKGFDIEIQGDNREAVKALLESRGYKVKLAGG